MFGWLRRRRERREEDRRTAYRLGAAAGCQQDRSPSYGRSMYRRRPDLAREWERGYDDVQG